MISKDFPYKHEFFKIFEEICRIPHGSGDTAALARFCVDFAEKNGCKAVIDKVGNVIIKKKAGKGFENAQPIIIQGHLDMVCDKLPESRHDFTRDPLKLKYDGKYISADGTTLGGDDGIAVAYALALVSDKEAQLPPLEILLTSDEETGLYGAMGLDGSMLSGKMLINIDSEEEGILLCGCAGGVVAKTTGEFPCGVSTHGVIKLTLSGCAGGHSGIEINKNRINAALQMAELIKSGGTDHRLISFVGGGKNNAIPCNCTVETIVEQQHQKQFIDNVKAAFESLKDRSNGTDDAPTLEINVIEGKLCNCLKAADSRKITEYLCSVPDGVVQTGETGVVTSLNTGVVMLKNGKFYSEALIRSMQNGDLDVIGERVVDTASAQGLSVEFSDRYPAWEYNAVSPLREKMVTVFEKMYGKKLQVSTIHAGLECGIISDKIEGMDAVSFGPDLLDVHTVNERLDAESAVRGFEYLKEVLKSLK